MRDERHHKLDQLLDLLADAVAERLGAAAEVKASRPQTGPGAEADREQPPAVKDDDERRTTPPSGAVEPPAPPEPTTEANSRADAGLPSGPDALEQAPAPQPVPEPPPPSHTARLLGRLALGLLALVVIINVPINRKGTTLATAMPDRRALVFRDGLVVKEEDNSEIYVYQDGRFRWISSLKAFEVQGYTWADVHVVEDGFLESHQMGPPLHAVLTCRDSPHIYRVEGDEKRWIVDIEAFEAEGLVWEDVTFVPCGELRAMPDGETIPPGQGPPPEP